MTNTEITNTLQLLAYKVRNHIHNILEKMVLNARIQFTIYSSPDVDINTASGSITPNDK
ncbi:hypothetical protein ACFL6P_05690 [Candidatus Latescibacterota bacterium]